MKKYLKLFSGLIIAVMLLVLIQPRVFAATSMTWFDFHYRYINNGTEIEITSYWGTDPDITVPSRIYDVPVTSVNLMAILHPEALRSVGIPAGVTEIQAGSLQNCPNLRELDFWGNAPRVWGSQNGQPFANNAPDFKIYYLPGKTGFANPWYGYIPQVAPAPFTDHAYYKSKGYTYQILPDNSAAIVKYNYGDYQPDVVIPAQLEGHPVRKIGPGTFKYDNINSVRIPDGVKSIGEYAFQYCGLKDVTIPGSVTRIEERAFYHCGLERVSLPWQVTFIGDEAFRECNELRMAKFFGEPASMGVQVFEACAPDFMIYYLPGVSGFTNPWNGYSTAELPVVPNNGGQQQAPVVLQAQAGAVNITLNWNRIADSKEISGFNVYKALTPEGLTGQIKEEAYVTGTTYLDRQVQSGTTYYYCVKPVYEDNSTGAPSNIVSAATQLSSGTAQAGTIQLTINNPIMTSNGVLREIDSGFGTAPLIKNGRTFLPIRAVISEIGGDIEWEGSENKITLHYDGKTVELWIGQTKARINGTETAVPAAPFISDTGRTMIPLRFVGESLGCDVSWDNITQTATISGYGIGDTPKVQSEVNIPDSMPVLPTGVPGSIPAPVISNLQLLEDDSGVPYFRMEVFIPETVRVLDQVRPFDGWVDLESLKVVDGGEEIQDGGGLEVFMQAPILGKPGMYYVTFEVIDEGGLSETLIKERSYTFKTRFSYAYGVGDGYEYVYSPWSNELSGQSKWYNRSEEE
jgi:hypothetical protein